MKNTIGDIQILLENPEEHSVHHVGNWSTAHGASPGLKLGLAISAHRMATRRLLLGADVLFEADTAFLLGERGLGLEELNRLVLVGGTESIVDSLVLAAATSCLGDSFAGVLGAHCSLV